MPTRRSCTYAIVRDITDRDLAEQALRRSHDEFEHRAEKRAAELRARNRDFLQLMHDRDGDRIDAKGNGYHDRMIHASHGSVDGRCPDPVTSATHGNALLNFLPHILSAPISPATKRTISCLAPLLTE